MRVLGVNGSTITLWVAVVDDDESVVADGPIQIPLPNDASHAMQLDLVRNDATRLLQSHEIDRVRILDAEPTGQPSYAQLIKRIGMESALVLAAHDIGVDVDRFSRAHVRSLLALGRTGTLTSHAGRLLEAASPHWSTKRDLAALVALAEIRS